MLCHCSQNIKTFPATHLVFLQTFPKLSLTLLVDGDIPPNAGLSSSSALVVAAALTVAKAAGFEISKVSDLLPLPFPIPPPAIPLSLQLEMAQLCAHAERYIGTEGGGMDQAVSLMAEAGKALLVDFGPPLTTQAHQLPTEVRFVVANSLVEVNKAAGNEFNQRVAECRLAAKLLTRRHSKDTGSGGSFFFFPQIIPSFGHLSCYCRYLSNMACSRRIH